jgi:hypothetical protein
MTATILWSVLAVLTVALVILTWQVLTHDPATCRVCVDRDARRRHPSAWGTR